LSQTLVGTAVVANKTDYVLTRTPVICNQDIAYYRLQMVNCRHALNTSANIGFINNITCTGKSLPLLAVSVNDADIATKGSVPSVHPSKIRTNLLESQSLMACCRTLNKATMLWHKFLLTPASIF
jgi:hypothetical protein